MENNLFEQASRAKLRFESTKGLLSVEDIWDLPLTSIRGASLNDVAKSINRQLKSSSEEDFVGASTTPVDKENKLKLDLVKYIISVKQAENEQERQSTDRKQKKARLLELIDQKQNKALEEKPLEELLQMVEAL